jgi:hypothetical protein
MDEMRDDSLGQNREQRGNLDIENSRPASVRYVIDVAHVSEIAGIRPGCSFILYDLSRPLPLRSRALYDGLAIRLGPDPSSGKHDLLGSGRFAEFASLQLDHLGGFQVDPAFLLERQTFCGRGVGLNTVEQSIGYGPG